MRISHIPTAVAAALLALAGAAAAENMAPMNTPDARDTPAAPVPGAPNAGGAVVAAGGKMPELEASYCDDSVKWGVKKTLKVNKKDFVYWLSGGNSIECFFGNRYIGGNLLSEIEDSLEELAVTKVALKNSFPEASRIALSDIKTEGAVTIANRNAKVTQIAVYRIKKKGLKPKPVPKDGAVSSEGYDKVAWLQENYVPRLAETKSPASFIVWLDVDAASRVDEMLTKLAQIQSNVFGGPSKSANRAALRSFLVGIAGDTRMTGRSYAELMLSLDENAAHSTPVVMVSNEKGQTLETQRWCVPPNQLNPIGHLEDRAKGEKCDPR